MKFEKAIYDGWMRVPDLHFLAIGIILCIILGKSYMILFPKEGVQESFFDDFSIRQCIQIVSIVTFYILQRLPRPLSTNAD